jgi:hypothetical protein
MNQWAVESEIYRAGAIARRAEHRTFASHPEASAWLTEQVKCWRAASEVTAYLARLCHQYQGQWVPVTVRHGCRKVVVKEESKQTGGVL